MAVTMAEIQKLRAMTGAGMMDCKKALEEANSDMEKAIELIRKRGQAIAAKRSDRQASEGCVLAARDKDFAAIVALCCETDFVATNAEFVGLTKQILACAMASRPENKEVLLNTLIDGRAVKDLITDKSGVTGEKMELGYYEFVKGNSVDSYIHPGNKLATIVAIGEKDADETAGHEIAMQIAAMNPVAIDAASVPQEVKDRELSIALEKTKTEQVHKAVEVALKKAGINPAHVDSEDHIESNMAKGWISAEDAAKAREIIKTVSEEKAANLPEQMIEKIAQGRLAKFFKESTLMEQEFIMDNTQTVGQYAKAHNVTPIAFKRVTLNQD